MSYVCKVLIKILRIKNV
jgi:hypothetical protein